PDRGGSRPIRLFSSVVLPTPLRPIRHTTSPAPTSRSTSRRTRLSPYDADSFSIRNIGFFPVLGQVHFDHPPVPLDLLHRPLAQHPALVEHRHRPGDLAA